MHLLQASAETQPWRFLLSYNRAQVFVALAGDKPRTFPCDGEGEQSSSPGWHLEGLEEICGAVRNTSKDPCCCCGLAAVYLGNLDKPPSSSAAERLMKKKGGRGKDLEQTVHC